MSNERCDIFISYRRDGGESLAMLLHDRLNDAGYRVFLDVESLNSGDFNNAILGKIEECTDMLVLLPPNALDRCANADDWVRREIEHGLKHKKNIVPVMMRGFVWPEMLPESLKQLPLCNGVTASSMELFDGVLMRLQEKLLCSKPVNAVPQHQEDPEFARLYHRFQYLMETEDLAGADKISLRLLEKYPDRPEPYLCRVQHSCQIAHWELLGTVSWAFENEHEWQYALRIAPPELKTQMEDLLAESLALREKMMEEYRLEEERKKNEAAERRARREAAKREKEAAAMRKAEQERSARQKEANRIYEEALLRFERLHKQSDLDELYEVRDMLISVQDVLPQAEEQIDVCTQLIAELLREPAEEAKLAEQILGCYSALDTVSNGFGKKKRKQKKGETGIISATGSMFPIALLADGTVIPLGKVEGWNDRKIMCWEKLSAFTEIGCAYIGVDADGKVYADNLAVADGAPDKCCYTEDWSDIVKVVGEYGYRSASKGKFLAGLKADGTVVTNDAFAAEFGLGHDTKKWSEIESIYAFGSLLIGVKQSGDVLVVDEFSLGRYDDMRQAIGQWSDVADFAGKMDHGMLAGRKKDGTLLVYLQEEWMYRDGLWGATPQKTTINEKGICQVDVCGKGELLLLNTRGELMLVKDGSATPQHVMSDVLGFCCRKLRCFALLRDGRVAEIDLASLKNQIYSCEMTEEAVREGLQNWHKLNARKLLAQREKELRSPFMFGKKKEKCERSIHVLKGILATR